jgi:serine/threonine protein phosphatase PrpC
MRGGAREIHAILASAVRLACQKIHEEGKADAERRGMGTTLSALLVVGSHGFVAHVGDSRIYLLRSGKHPADHRGPHRLQRAREARVA